MRITDRHRALLGDGTWDDDSIREHLTELELSELDNILDQRELEGLHMGYRERVTDMHLPHIVDLPNVLPELFADAAGPPHRRKARVEHSVGRRCEAGAYR